MRTDTESISNDIIDEIIDNVENSDIVFCKFLSANDTGSTGAHQAGIYIPKNGSNILFEKEGVQLIQPEPYIKSLPKEYQNKVWNLKEFISFIRKVEE